MKKFVTVFLLFAATIIISNAQVDTIWTKVMGGSQNEAIGTTILNNIGSPCASVDVTFNGFIYVVTSTTSNDFWLKQNYGQEDVWLIKMNTAGDTIWTKVFGGSSYDRPGRVRALPDGGCIIAGRTTSTDGDFAGGHGGQEGFIIRLNANGSVIWKKLYGGSDNDYLYDVTPTSDGNFVACGESNSVNGDLAGTGAGLAWVIKVNGSNGNKIWSYTYLGPNSSSPDFLENFYRIVELSNGSGFIATGYTTPSYNNVNADDIYYHKISPSGASKWAKKVGSTNGGEGVGAILDAGNGQFYIAGKLAGGSGADVTSGYYGGNGDMWLLKFDSAGTKLWDRHYGGTDWEFVFEMIKDADNDLYLAGFTRSTNYEASGVSYGGIDFWVIKTNPNGDTLWTKRAGGTGNDVAMGMGLLGVNSVVMAGKTLSSNGCVHGSYGGQDLWIVRIDSIGTVSAKFPEPQRMYIYPNPVNDHLYIKLENNSIKTIELFDLAGKKLLSTDKNNLSLSGFAEGLYILRVCSDKMVFTEKIIVKH